MLVGRVVARLRRAERRHLDRFGSGVDVDEPEPAPDDEGAAEQRLHLLGPCVGGDVEVLRLDAEQEVAHRAADDEGLESGVVQPPRDVERAAGELLAANRMVAGPVDARLTFLFPSGQEAGEQAADHRARTGRWGQRVARSGAGDAGARRMAARDVHRRRRRLAVAGFTKIQDN